MRVGAVPPRAMLGGGSAPNRKGPALLPAPLSPASTVRTALLPPCGRSRTIRWLAAVMRDRAPTSAFRTHEVLLHRDARRIGPDPGARPVGATRSDRLRLSPWSVVQRLSAFRTGKAPTGGASRRWAPSGGGRVPKHRSVRLAVPTRSLRSVSSASPSGLLPSVGFPAVPFGQLSILPKQAFGRSFRAAAIRPTVARLSRHLRFAKPFERKNQGCFPTLLRASLPSLPV